MQRLFFSLILTISCAACSPDYEKMAAERIEYARNNDKNKGDISIAVIQNAFTDAYLNGVKLATEHINQRDGKLSGRRLRLSLRAPDNGGFEENRNKILNVADDPTVVAVLGHGRSSVAIPASVIYEQSKLVFLCPFSTAQAFTRHDFRYVFRMVPGNPVLANQIASIAEVLGYERIVILHARDKLNRELAFLVEDAAVKKGITLAKRASFFANTTDYRSVIANLIELSFDAIFLAAPVESAARLANQLHEMGVHQPVLNGDEMAGEYYAVLAGAKASNKTIMPIIYKPAKKNPVSQRFTQSYKKKYQQEPDLFAAQGYDSVMILAEAIERAGSTVSPAISSTLHYMPPFAGVTGLHAFDDAGDVQGKKYFFQVLREGKAHYLPAIEQFYFLDKFSAELLQKFIQPVPDEEYKKYLFELAYEILKFDRIGIIYEDTEEGRKTAYYAILKKVAQNKGFEVEECQIPFSFLKKDKTESELLSCYGKLALNIDALFVPAYPGVDRDFIQYLHESLKFYQIPSVAFSGPVNPPGVSFLIGKRSDVVLGRQGNANLYSDLLHNIKTHQFAEQLSGLPEVIVNLDNLTEKEKSLLLGKPIDMYFQSW